MDSPNEEATRGGSTTLESSRKSSVNVESSGANEFCKKADSGKSIGPEANEGPEPSSRTTLPEVSIFS